MGVLFGTYNFVALIFAFLITPIARMTSRKFVHFASLILGGLGLLSMYVLPQEWLVPSMVGVGIAWASILTVPYALLVDALPAEKMGIYMGIFNFFIVLPQIVNALIGGWIVHGFLLGLCHLLRGRRLDIPDRCLLTLRTKEPLFAGNES